MSHLEKQLEKLKLLKNQGHVIVIKLDGERKNNSSTILDTPPNKEMKRYDGDNLLNLLEEANSHYNFD